MEDRKEWTKKNIREFIKNDKLFKLFIYNIAQNQSYSAKKAHPEAKKTKEMMKMFKTRKCLKKEINDAEERSLTHFKKLFQIEQIIKKSDESNEIYAITIEKIKKVIL